MSVIELSSGIIASLVAAVLFGWFRSKLKAWYPSERAVRDVLRGADDIGGRIEVLTWFTMIFLVWLFLGNLFWILAEWGLEIWQYLSNSVAADQWTHRWDVLGRIARGTIFGLKLLALLCFAAGVLIIRRVHRVRTLLFD